VHVYRSTNKGIDWTNVANVKGQYWSNLFVRGTEVYLIGTASDGYAGGRSVQISRSTDRGSTWTSAVRCRLSVDMRCVTAAVAANCRSLRQL
jgi:photosystem II stability/assembly factor-like uncharacterized protein